MKRLALIFLLALSGLLQAQTGAPIPGMDVMQKYGTCVGTTDRNGVLHMKPGFSLHSEIHYYVDDCGCVRAVRHYYLDYRGCRFTD